MPVETSQLHDVKVAIADALAARPGLADVAIFTAYPGDDAPHEFIALLGRARSLQGWASSGNRRRQEDLSLPGVVFVLKPGGGESVIREARARAYELYGELEAYFVEDPSLGGVVLQVQQSEHNTIEGVEPSGRFCEIQFVISTMNRLTRS